MNKEKIYLPSIDEEIMVEFEFIKDKDERGHHEYYVFHSFKAKQFYPTANDLSADMQIWCNTQLNDKQIVELERELDKLRKERNEDYLYE